MIIKKVAVIGAGTMGAGIAGQAANAGCDVLLLDLANPDLTSPVGERNAFAQKGLDRISNPSDPGILSSDVAGRITVGNIDDDFDKLADCDWIAEAILERLDLK